MCGVPTVLYGSDGRNSRKGWTRKFWNVMLQNRTEELVKLGDYGRLNQKKGSDTYYDM